MSLFTGNTFQAFATVYPGDQAGTAPVQNSLLGNTPIACAIQTVSMGERMFFARDGVAVSHNLYTETDVSSVPHGAVIIDDAGVSYSVVDRELMGGRKAADGTGKWRILMNRLDKGAL